MLLCEKMPAGDIIGVHDIRPGIEIDGEAMLEVAHDDLCSRGRAIVIGA
jgi:hypothetical protein